MVRDLTAQAARQSATEALQAIFRPAGKLARRDLQNAK